MSEDVKENIKNTNVWKRLLHMLLFSVFYWVAKIVLIAVIAFQFLMSLFTGKNDGPAALLGSQISSYIYQVFRFLTYNTETHPFPFSDWPSGDELVAVVPSPEKPKRKAAPRRKPTKKKTEASEKNAEVSDKENATKE
ncbi:MAG: DUF4389 domain-containing protein [Mariprofundaceae bacterium]